MAKTIVGIDVGGTFTDIAVPNFESGRRLADGYDAGYTTGLGRREGCLRQLVAGTGVMNFGTPAQLNESLHRSGLKC